MNTIEAIDSRRSCKAYNPDKLVPQDIVKKICDAGTKAASGMNKQASKILVVNNKAVRDKIVKLNADVFKRDLDPFYGAPQIIVVLADRNVHTYVYDGSLVLGNMMLAAEELGIGSCWIHRAKEVFNTDEGKQILKDAGIDGDYEGIGNLAIGYPTGEKREAPAIKDDYINYIN